MEEWKEIPGYEGMYEASSLGRIRSMDRLVRHYTGVNRPPKGNIMKFITTKPGYKQLMLSKLGIRNCHQVHKLVSSSFIPNPENKPQVNHKNGIKTDNRVENLEWCTPKENVEHAYRTGLNSSIGINHHKAILNEDQVRLIKYLLPIKSVKFIADLIGVRQRVIGNIKYANGWKHIN